MTVGGACEIVWDDAAFKHTYAPSSRKLFAPEINASDPDMQWDLGPTPQPITAILESLYPEAGSSRRTAVTRS